MSISLYGTFANSQQCHNIQEIHLLSKECRDPVFTILAVVYRTCYVHLYDRAGSVLRPLVLQSLEQDHVRDAHEREPRHQEQHDRVDGVPVRHFELVEEG